MSRTRAEGWGGFEADSGAGDQDLAFVTGIRVFE
jgi:hypothetical protein